MGDPEDFGTPAQALTAPLSADADTPERSIDVIVPARNCAGLLAECLEAAIPELGRGDRLVVVDDGSTDETRSVAERAGAIVIRQSDPGGPYVARQHAALESRAWALVFLDARCRPLPGWLESHRRLLSTSGAALSCSNVFAVAGSSIASRIACYQQPFRLEATIEGWHLPYYPACNLGVVREAFLAVGGFPHVRSGGDAQLCWRVQMAGFGSLAVDTATRVHWIPRSSMIDLAEQWWRYGRSSATMAAETAGPPDGVPGHAGQALLVLLHDAISGRVAPSVAIGTLLMGAARRLGILVGHVDRRRRSAA